MVMAGCRAQPAGPGDAVAIDMATPGDLSGADLSEFDQAEPPDACVAVATEVCNNGCDDDGNGFLDGEDPACTPQVLATFEGGSPQLERLLLGAIPSTRFLDGNMVSSRAHAVYNGGFAPGIAFVVLDLSARELVRITLPAGSGMGARDPVSFAYGTRDVCIFNGELILVDPGGRLHRLMADGRTEIGTVAIPRWMPYGSTLLSACASDGQYLYVATHSVTGMPTKFEVLDSNFMTPGVPADISQLLLDDGYDRCLDFAWTSKGFYGLFVNSGGQLNDSVLVSELHAPFALDGGVGPAVDGGVLHGLGEFTP